MLFFIIFLLFQKCHLSLQFITLLLKRMFPDPISSSVPPGINSFAPSLLRLPRAFAPLNFSYFNHAAHKHTYISPNTFSTNTPPLLPPFPAWSPPSFHRSLHSFLPSFPNFFARLPLSFTALVFQKFSYLNYFVHPWPDIKFRFFSESCLSRISSSHRSRHAAAAHQAAELVEEHRRRGS